MCRRKDFGALIMNELNEVGKYEFAVIQAMIKIKKKGAEKHPEICLKNSILYFFSPQQLFCEAAQLFFCDSEHPVAGAAFSFLAAFALLLTFFTVSFFTSLVLS